VRQWIHGRDLIVRELPRCKKCGFAFKEHAISTPEEVEFLRSLGYGVFVCKDVEDNPFLKGFLEIVAMTQDNEFLKSHEIEKMYKKNKEPDNPCDRAFMKEIST
jgi:hypothetical protein